ncbi:hypothetical protein [Parvularcula lutaonensis]|uniref:Aquaporin Z n=1 Tax=Parvularcula lutaonensis TaxID=491923 RepID=A0ABV7MCC0_9PROT|nr:hypothetical protein [Parvularcula lutaonensis]GGY37596.1 hypothetical protein GCM10007148_02340 [Parvularcula lutaonensis]
MRDRKEKPLGLQLARALAEGVVTAVLFTTAVLVAGSILGMQDRLAGPNTGTIIAICGGLGLLLSGRLTISAFDERGS